METVSLGNSPLNEYFDTQCGVSVARHVRIHIMASNLLISKLVIDFVIALRMRCTDSIEVTRALRGVLLEGRRVVWIKVIDALCAALARAILIAEYMSAERPTLVLREVLIELIADRKSCAAVVRSGRAAAARSIAAQNERRLLKFVKNGPSMMMSPTSSRTSKARSMCAYSADSSFRRAATSCPLPATKALLPRTT